MKNIHPLRKEATTLYNDILDQRRDLELTKRLKLLMPKIKEQVTVYEENIVTLSAINPLPWSEQEKSDLLTFSKKCKITDQIKAELKNLSPYKCQYCGISEIDSIDHYLPKSKYPEYSFLTINLIPCCPTCNKFKGEFWLEENGERLIINYYFDPIDKERFLFCKIVYSDNIPVPIFALDFTNIDESFSSVISHHFAQLHLLDRYGRGSNEVITDAISALLVNIKLGIMSENLKNKDFKAILSGQAQKFREDYGKNYWKAAIIEGLSLNETFLIESFKI